MNLGSLQDLLRDSKQRVTTVCVIEEPVAKAMQAKTVAVFLSYVTLVKQCVKHPDIRAVDYSLLSDAITQGMVVLDKSKHRSVQICYQHPAFEDKRYRVFLKTTGTGDEIYVESLHRTRPRQTKSVLKRGKLLRNHS
jgi:hypothetical protein